MKKMFGKKNSESRNANPMRRSKRFSVGGAVKEATNNIAKTAVGITVGTAAGSAVFVASESALAAGVNAYHAKNPVMCTVKKHKWSKAQRMTLKEAQATVAKTGKKFAEATVESKWEDPKFAAKVHGGILAGSAAVGSITGVNAAKLYGDMQQATNVVNNAVILDNQYLRDIVVEVEEDED